jgi:hypothetical protein
VGLGLRMQRHIRESGIGLPHSTTLARLIARQSFRKVLECGCPLPLFLEISGAFADAPPTSSSPRHLAAYYPREYAR